ncbi:glycoside hydrolase family 97 protein [Dysgonomonas sp. 511]|uniref:glycoside hydrolase family 97 protein n=1 Tax=Dysgonomonas sp. 511 TaxID=2302930 RepID=UPI0013D645B4|nr:glycoside hydrolase family 97 protein [Dysgonomonas sp. 511]NDV79163.1 alpha-glucosidase [Dysgonomonas sp. 511]
MKKLISILSFFLITSGTLSAQAVINSTHSHLTSPDGKYSFEVYQKEFPGGTKQLYYTLAYNGKTVVEESELGVLIENQLFESALGIPNDTSKIWGENLNLTDKKTNTVDETWKPVYGERNTIRNHYNELTLKFLKGEDNPGGHEGGYDRRRYYMMDFVVRAYNEGVAFRYHFPEATNGLFLHITGEQTQFTLPEGTMAYYERWAQGAYSLKPLKDWGDECERPLTMKLQNGLTVALAEAEMVDYARMKFRLNDKNANTLQASLYSSVDAITPYNTPWRVIMAAEKATELIVNNDIILNLNPENKIKDTSWIKPGKVIRVSKLTQEDAKKCVDFAAERGLQYIHIDASWYGPEMSMSSDATTVAENRDFDIPALTTYAASKGIGLMVYVNQRALVQQLDEILPLYKKWGIKGIKFGFVQIGNQHWSTWLHDAIKKCAEYEMLVDIHDEYRPTGFSRTYPNLMTQEGIRGNEEFPDATHNTILPFTRFLAGAGDYTICYYNNRIKTTHAHQLAMAAVYYSPLQFMYWYDQPSAYKGEPEIEFFDKVKTVWDDTKVIDGDIGEYVTIARRSNKDWFLGTLGNNDARNIATPLSFLHAGQKYIASIYTDDDKAETKTKVRVTRLIVDSTSVLSFSLKPSGGCAIYLTPATKEDLKKYKPYKKNQLL